MAIILWGCEAIWEGRLGAVVLAKVDTGRCGGSWLNSRDETRDEDANGNYLDLPWAVADDGHSAVHR